VFLTWPAVRPAGRPGRSATGCTSREKGVDVEITAFVGQRRPARRPGPSVVRPRLENLEDRTLLSVDLASTFEGIGFSGYIPPDTIAAVGPNHVVEAINLQLAYIDKVTGARSVRPLQSFFAPLGGVLQGSDPVVLYDEETGQFVVGMLDYNGGALSRFDLAVSNDSDPNDGFYYGRYDMNDGVGGNEFADYPRMGYNADAYVIGFNMFLNGSSFDHVDVLSIDKTTLTGYRAVVPGGAGNFTLVPAAMHFSNYGDPVWLVESGVFNSMKVVQLTNELSDSPSFSTTTVVVGTHGAPPNATQPGSGTIPIGGLGDRVYNAAMINGQLVAAHTVGSGGVGRVRWYQFDTTSGTPVLYQSGTIDQGPGVYTYMPTIDINYEGDLGLTFMESSPSEYVSMYVTGQSIYDAPGTLQTPVVTHPGTSRYTISRVGDFSGISVDPNDGYTFWAANEYKGSSPYFNTGIASFGVSPSMSPPAPAGLRQAARVLTAAAAPAAATPGLSVAPAGAPADGRSEGPGVALVDWVFAATRQKDQDPVAPALRSAVRGAAQARVPDLLGGESELWQGASL
jgi:hypothetical protein